MSRIVGFALLVLLSSACRSSVPDQMEMLRARSYESIEELAVDSDAIALIEVTGTNNRLERDGLAMTKTEAKVVRALRGELPTFIVFRQLGPNDNVSGGELPIVKRGDRYLAFLKRDSFTEEDPAIQYWPTGAAGLFSASSPDGPYERLDQVSKGLPPTLTVDEVIRQTEGVVLKGTG